MSRACRPALTVLLCLCGLAWAQGTSMNVLVERLKRAEGVARVAAAPLGARLQGNAREAKWFVWVKDDTDRVTRVGLFVAHRTGTRNVNRIGIILDSGTDLELARYALGYLSGLMLTGCLGVANVQAIGQWFEDRYQQALSLSGGEYQNAFGVVSVSFFMDYANGSFAMAINRTDRAGAGGWPRFCTIP